MRRYGMCNCFMLNCCRIDEKLKQSDDWRTNAYPPGTRKLIRHLSSGVCAVKWPWKVMNVL